MARSDHQTLSAHGSGSEPWSWTWRIALVLASAALIWLLWWAWDNEALLTWKRQASPTVFFLALALLPALGVPSTPFFLVAGATFGIPIGLAGSLAALAVNLTVCYFIARGRIARGRIRARLLSLIRRLGYEFPDFKEQDSALRFTILLKLAPGIPLVIKHYLLALSGVPFSVYFGVSMVFGALYATPLVLLGDSAFEHDLSNAGLAALVLVALGAAAWLWRKRSKQKQLAEA